MSESLKPPIERKRPIMLGCTWVAAIYTFCSSRICTILAVFAPQPHRSASCPRISAVDNSANYCIFDTNLLLGIMMIMHIGANYEEYEKQCKQ